jgi:hypothetical protein
MYNHQSPVIECHYIPIVVEVACTNFANCDVDVMPLENLYQHSALLMSGVQLEVLAQEQIHS